MPRAGRVFEQTVALIERAIAGEASVTLESPKSLVDRVTGQPREMDIVLTYHLPNRDLLVAIECRDHARPCGSSQVEAYHTKCQHTGVNLGIIVAANGFTAPAREKATFLGLNCIHLQQLEEVDWFVQDELTFRQRYPVHTDIQLGLPMALQGHEWRLFASIEDGDDEEIDLQYLRDENDDMRFVGRPDGLIDRVWNEVPDPTSDLLGHVDIELGNPEVFYALDDEGNAHPLRKIDLSIDWEAQEEAMPVSRYRYHDAQGNVDFQVVMAGAFVFFHDARNSYGLTVEH